MGGEYPIASSSASERAEAEKKLQFKRGETVILVFAMQVRHSPLICCHAAVWSVVLVHPCVHSTLAFAAAASAHRITLVLLHSPDKCCLGLRMQVAPGQHASAILFTGCELHNHCLQSSVPCGVRSAVRCQPAVL